MTSPLSIRFTLLPPVEAWEQALAQWEMSMMCVALSDRDLVPVLPESYATVTPPPLPAAA